jgi:predicted O-methyltransferase YrrM
LGIFLKAYGYVSLGFQTRKSQEEQEMLSIDSAMIRLLLENTLPSFQLTSRQTLNLGFGFIFYAITRTVRPQNVVVIGSKAGFAPICFALGLKDNEGYGIDSVECYDTTLASFGGRTELHFIDPSYSLHRNDPNHNFGEGVWDDPEDVRRLWVRFGVDAIVTHFKMTSAEYLQSDASHRRIDLLYIDGDHSYDGIRHDMLAFMDHLWEGSLVLAHDVHPGIEEADGYRVLCNLPPETYEYVRIPILPGLAIMRPVGLGPVAMPLRNPELEQGSSPAISAKSVRRSTVQRQPRLDRPEA